MSGRKSGPANTLLPANIVLGRRELLNGLVQGTS